MSTRDTHFYMLIWGVSLFAASAFLEPVMALAVVRGACIGLVGISLLLFFTDDPQGRP